MELNERRQDTVLRVVVTMMQQEGYTLTDRSSVPGEATAVLLHREGELAEPHTREFVLLTHEGRRRCVRADQYRRPPGQEAAQPLRTVYHYYEPEHVAQPAAIARALVATVRST